MDHHRGRQSGLAGLSRINSKPPPGTEFRGAVLSLKVRFIVLLLMYPEHRKTGEEQNTMDYSIVWVRGHVEVYDWAGRFCFSADNEREALEELARAA